MEGIYILWYRIFPCVLVRSFSKRLPQYRLACTRTLHLHILFYDKQESTRNKVNKVSLDSVERRSLDQYEAVSPGKGYRKESNYQDSKRYLKNLIICQFSKGL